MADVFETMQTLGVPSSDMTDLAAVEPFRVSTIGERLMLRAAMEHAFNTPEDAFIENPWGFPYIPLPTRRATSTTGLVIAPESISFDGVGHPIYWIDPALTRRTDEERQHPERWAIRMFYLIMSFGMFDPETLRWYNVPRTQGIDYTEQDWVEYRQGTGSLFDTVKPLTEDLLIEPLESVYALTRTALEKCGEAQAQVLAGFRTELDAAYTTAVATTQGRSEWDGLEQRMRGTLQQIVEAVENGTVPTSRVSAVYAEVDELERIVRHTERCALLLSLPLLGSSTIGDRAALAATALNAGKAEVDIDFNVLRTEAHKLFELSSASSAKEFVTLYETANAYYIKAWRALMISASNLVRAGRGASIYHSWEAFELAENMNDMTWPPLGTVLDGIGV